MKDRGNLAGSYGFTLNDRGQDVELTDSQTSRRKRIIVNPGNQAVKDPQVNGVTASGNSVCSRF